MRRSRRELAGQIVRSEYQRRGWKAKDADQHVGVSPATLYRIYDGDPRVQDFSLSPVEGGLELPSGLLSYIIAGDVDRIERLQMRDDLKSRILSELHQMAFNLADEEIGNEDS
jgi:hypothetical protein